MTRSIISRDPEVMGGTAVLSGTRAPITALFDYIETGDTVESRLSLRRADLRSPSNHRPHASLAHRPPPSSTAEPVTPPLPFAPLRPRCRSTAIPPIPGGTYPVGTDDQGRDLFSAILYGLRISFTVAAISGFFAAVIGTALGLLASFRGGWIDRIVMRVVDVQLSLPVILVALVLLAILGRAVENTIIALVTVQWVFFARTVRGSVLVEREKEYVAAGRLMGYSDARLMFRHVLPNCAGRLPPAPPRLIATPTPFPSVRTTARSPAV